MLTQEVIDRLETMARSCGHKSQRAFALTAGLNPIAFGENIRIGKEPRFSTLEAILKANPQVSAEWLMRGKGDMFLTGEQPAANVIHIDKSTRTVGGSGVAGDGNTKSLIEQISKEIATLNEQLRVKDEQIKAKDEQLRNKDTQMASLLSILDKHPH